MDLHAQHALHQKKLNAPGFLLCKSTRLAQAVSENLLSVEWAMRSFTADPL
jgi:hypothetical protein